MTWIDVEFVVRHWSAWADGLNRVRDWESWACGQMLRIPAPGAMPVLPQVPALARRRLNRLGRMALHVLHEARSGAHAALELPVVFASRYGDSERALGEIGALARGEPVSPAAFGLSVHNAIGATGAIIDGCRANMVAIAAADRSAAAGLVEALGLLHDGASEVLLVCYDEELPPAYAEFIVPPVGAWAWAWRLALRGPGRRLRLQNSVAGAPANDADALPDGLQALRVLLGALEGWHDGQWHWQRLGMEADDAAQA